MLLGFLNRRLRLWIAVCHFFHFLLCDSLILLFVYLFLIFAQLLQLSLPLCLFTSVSLALPCLPTVTLCQPVTLNLSRLPISTLQVAPGSTMEDDPVLSPQPQRLPSPCDTAPSLSSHSYAPCSPIHFLPLLHPIHFDCQS